MKNTVYRYYHLEWQDILNGYSMGIFPMGDDEEGLISWFEASPRAIMPVELPSSNINIPRSLKQVITKIFTRLLLIRLRQVINECAEASTWINDIIKAHILIL
jgi:Leu/Phe-tRNA-protein transferase